MLSVIAEQAPDDTGKRARKLYDHYIALYDDMVDLGDVVNTGVVFDGGGASMKKVLKSLTRAAFIKLLAGEASLPATKKFLELCRSAAEVYIKKGVLTEAAHCLTRVIAHGPTEKEDYEKLAEVFGGLHNPVLPGYIRGLSKDVAF